jgi:beta-galactosidase
VADAAVCLKEMLEMNAHVNFYMFHGGTNFGFMNGANCTDGKYLPTVSSYDYDAPLSEDGTPTPKYHAFREIIAEYVPGLLDQKILVPSVKKAYGKVELSQFAPLFDNLSKVGTIHSTVNTDSMEEFGQNYGFILYSKRISGPVEDAILTIQEPRDRAVVFINGMEAAVIYRNDENHSFELQIPPEGVQVDILVENMGRVNYGDNMSDARKGITHGVRIGGQFQFGWDVCSLPMEDLSELDFSSSPVDCGPGFFKGEFSVDKACDTFLKVPTGKKGICWINGFNLGRYWEIGPTRTLYIPAPLLEQGPNEIVVFEQHAMTEQYVELLDKPELG